MIWSRLLCLWGPRRAVTIILYATAWGPRHGGVNAFNRNLAVALAGLPEGRGRVFCAVAGEIDEVARADAMANNVELIAIAPGQDETFPLAGTKSVKAFLADRLADARTLHIGHDSVTGAAANHARTAMPGESLVIHHMNYEAYQGVKAGLAARAEAKVQAQREIFQRADRVAAVGPLLANLARNMVGGVDILTLNPGLEVVENHSPNDVVAALTYGRFDRANTIIKQAPLVAAGFGAACKDRSITAFNNHCLRVIGLDHKDVDEDAKLKEIADAAAGGRVINILPLPFAGNPEALKEQLRRANLACVLSFHEGFGLSAWEAIGAAVPLVVTKNSGVYKLVSDLLGPAGKGCLFGVDIEARRESPHYTEKDVETVSAAIRQVAANLEEAKLGAEQLRSMLLKKGGLTWTRAAQQVLGLNPSSAAGAAVAPSDVPRARPVSVRLSAQNPLSGCAEMSLSTTQGSDGDAFDVMPEVRFGMEEVRTTQGVFRFGVKRAVLRLHLTNCSVVPGVRLGDRSASSPHIAARPETSWELTGPLENGVLSRSVLGNERLCCVALTGSVGAVEATLKCRKSDLKMQRDGKLSGLWGTNQKKIIELFLAKCLAQDEIDATLSLASMTLEATNQ